MSELQQGSGGTNCSVYRNQVLWGVVLLSLVATFGTALVAYHTRDAALAGVVAGVPAMLIVNLFNLLKSVDASRHAQNAVEQGKKNEEKVAEVSEKMEKVKSETSETKSAMNSLRVDLRQTNDLASSVESGMRKFLGDVR